jgi:hypothetical protein
MCTRDDGPRSRGNDTMAGGITIRVSCYAGYRPDERPVSFVLGEKSLEVRDILDRWYGTDRRYFKVKADDGNIYILACDEAGEGWDLVSFRKTDWT